MTLSKLLLSSLLALGTVFAAAPGSTATPRPDDPPAPMVPKSNPVNAYFARLGMTVDSACTPYLFYQVHEWLGTRYHYAGHTKKGIDCSGFVAEMYRTVYCIQLGGGSKDIFAKVDTVGRANLQEGDILFFKIRKGQVSHVGIYLGNNKFAHASVHSGVVVSDLNEDYYRKYFFAGGRLKQPVYIAH